LVKQKVKLGDLVQRTSSTANKRWGPKPIYFLYSFVFISVLHVIFYIASLFNSKARRGIKGRKKLFDILKKNLATIPEGNRIWFHASSLGEFEQAKPVIEILKRSGYRIIVSFFSPSGYEHSLNYSSADVITYIPFDTPRNARRFVELVKPRVVVIMRYDLWPNHLFAAKRFGAKVIVADATFSSKLFNRAKVLRNFYRWMYLLADLILATNQGNKKMFDFFLENEVAIVGGDTRFDRVYQKSIFNDVSHKIPIVIDRSERICMILGSTWRSDIDILRDPLIRLSKEFENLSIIIVPHEPTSEEVNRLRSEFSGARILSEMNNDSDNRASCYIIDRVGLLTQLYVLGDIAYVGGGFGAGVHNVLEPAVYGIPIITGPRIEGSDEAMQLMQEGGLFYVKDSISAYRVMLKMVRDELVRRRAGEIAKNYVMRNLGASTVVAEHVMKFCGD
jgi:3-deoxy-D-manno-octulosonic-acid transferase